MEYYDYAPQKRWCLSTQLSRKINLRDFFQQFSALIMKEKHVRSIKQFYFSKSPANCSSKFGCVCVCVSAEWDSTGFTENICLSHRTDIASCHLSPRIYLVIYSKIWGEMEYKGGQKQCWTIYGISV